MKRQRGRQPNSISRLPADFYRTKAWCRVLKYSVAPELSQIKAEEVRATNKINKEIGVDLSSTQWKGWWDGDVYPNKKSTDKFLEVYKNKKTKEADKYIKLLEWLKPVANGYPLQLHFLAIDTLINAYSPDKNKRKESLKNVTKIMDAIHEKWAPSIPFGDTNYIYEIHNREYGIPFSTDEIDFKFKVQEKASEKFKQALPHIYDPFNPNSVLVFMLSLALYQLLPSYHHYKHWVLDFISGLMAMYAYRIIKNINDEMVSPSIIGNMTNWCDHLLNEEMKVDDMVYPFIQNTLPFEVNEELLANTLHLTHAIYHNATNEIGLSLHDMNAKWDDAYEQHISELAGNIKPNIGTFLGH